MVTPITGICNPIGHANIGNNMTNILQLIMNTYIRDCNKHDIANDPIQYAHEKINEMTNVELLEAISHHLDLIIIELCYD